VSRKLSWSDLTLPPINLFSLPALKVVVVERKQEYSREVFKAKLVDNPIYERRKRE